MFDNRLKTLREAKGHNMKKMAAELDIPYMTYVHYEKNEREPNSETLVRMAEYFGVSTDYLMGRTDLRGYAAAPVSDNAALFEQYPELLPVMTKKIPLLGSVACGEPIFDDTVNCYIDLASDVNADFCLVCKGDSMINARIHDGDLVYIRQTEMVENGQIAAVSIDNEVTLKRVYYYPEKNKLVLNPENPQYEPFVYTNEELDGIKILGRAVAFTSIVK